jgi:citrate synthase
MILKEKLNKIIPTLRERVIKLEKESGEVIVGEVTISQIFGGMRNVKSLVTDISYVDADKGIHLRGYSIPEIISQLPRLDHAEMPLVGGLYYLLLIGEMPTLDQALEVEDEWKIRGKVPVYVYDLLDTMPTHASPMAMFSQAILSMQGESVFARKYDEGLRKEDYWDPMLEDSLELTAKLPAIAAYIYHLKRNYKKVTSPDLELDWASNYAKMMGIMDPTFPELARLYFIIHSDHESGNVSAHTAHLVASALSDIYYATSASMNGLAGPLHGRANQETLHWLMNVYEKYGGIPDKEELRDFAWETLNSGRVIPGYGHAVLRKTDPRFSVLSDFGKKHIVDDDLFKLASLVYEVVPSVLEEQGKAKNPWPNVDAISGALLYHYGVSDCTRSTSCGFYTVMFGMSRILGVSSNIVWARALGLPLERPKSLTTPMLEKIASDNHKGD